MVRTAAGRIPQEPQVLLMPCTAAEWGIYMELRYNNLAGLVCAATESGRQISELVLADQAEQMEKDRTHCV